MGWGNHSVHNITANYMKINTTFKLGKKMDVSKKKKFWRNRGESKLEKLYKDLKIKIILQECKT